MSLIDNFPHASLSKKYHGFIISSLTCLINKYVYIMYFILPLIIKYTYYVLYIGIDCILKIEKNIICIYLKINKILK